MKVSVVVPTYDSAEWIGTCLASVRKSFKGELIVVDGGSQDGTTAKVMDYRACIYRSSLNFSEQCNEGAREAMGDVVLFLSPQVEVLPGWREAIEEALQSEYVVGGGLRTIWEGESLKARLFSWGQDFGSRCLDVSLAPQGIFVRRKSFLSVGGFSPNAVLPHLWLAQKLKAVGEFSYLDAAVKVMVRPWESKGMVATSLGYVKAYREHRRLDIN